VPLRRPAGGGVRLSEVLRRLLGDRVAVVEDFELYGHQVEALGPLLGGGSVGVLLASPNASGKTEVGVLGALGAVTRGGGRLVLVLYPARALARDQFERWREGVRGWLRAAGWGVEVGRFYLSCPLFCVVLLDGDTARRGALEALGWEGPLVVLTNPAFLLSALRSGWRRYFGERCLSLLVLDEVHFYSARDLTLLVKVLEPVLQFHSCRDEVKVLALSATVGDPRGLVEQLRGAWGVVGEWRVVEASYSEEASGFKEVCVWWRWGCAAG